MTDKGVTGYIGVDVGGTFTDVLLETNDGFRETVKVPTTSPPHSGVIEGVEAALDVCPRTLDTVSFIRHGTTVATNALLERTGARTSLVTTGGFRDVLEIGRQTRDAVYSLDVTKPEPLVPRHRRFEIAERTAAPDHECPGSVAQSPSASAIADLADAIQAVDTEAVAVCLLHAYADDSHERQVGASLREHLDIPVLLSSEVRPEFREYERTATTVASAYLTPVLAEYFAKLQAAFAARSLPAPDIMQSNGGIGAIDEVLETPAVTALSGPAAGVVGGLQATQRTLEQSVERLLTLDMGGTSTDVGVVIDGDIEQTTQLTIGDIPLQQTAVDVRTVGAGGGSIAWIDDGGALRVGPQSAGAEPGPACYGRGGMAPTVTDAALLLGYLSPGAQLGRSITLDQTKAETALASLQSAIEQPPTEVAAGIVNVVSASLAQAIRSVTIERGRDPRDFTLCAFGGAGGMFAPTVAETLDIASVVLPRNGGVLSAQGLCDTDERHDMARTHRRPLSDEHLQTVEAVFDELEDTARSRSSLPTECAITWIGDLRYIGQSFSLSLELETPLSAATIVDRFHAHHERERGYRLDEPVEIVTCRVRAMVDTSRDLPLVSDLDSPSLEERTVAFPEAGASQTTIYRGDPNLHANLHVPAIVERQESTVVIPPGWDASVTPSGAIVLTRGDRP